ncbi:TPA: TM2 domain-containing protein, partial [Staphylococcus aureus]|nr:TM2 domain-containing protein [Staphylococcus aureus]
MQVNKVIYILLALFLGSFGIHKFYAGKNMQGILHLIFCWTGIPHILAIISAVINVF